MKSVVGTDNVDAQLGDGLPAEVVLGLPQAEIADCDRAAAIVLLGPDLEEELPVLHLRIRRAAVELDVPIVDFAVVAHGLSEHAQIVERRVAGEDLGTGALEQIARARGDRTGPVVVVLGRPSLAESAAIAVRAAGVLRGVPDVRFLSAMRRGNVHGALDAGLAPGFLPGRVSLDGGRERFSGTWGGRLPASRGMDAHGVLGAAAAGQIEVLVLLGADPVADFPDAELARRGVAGANRVIAIDAFVTASSGRADVILPTTLWGEKAGTVTNLEGRVQRVGRKVAAEGTAMDDWRIAGELALRLGTDFDLATVDEITDEMARVAPAFEGATAALLQRARDGVVLPLRDHHGEIVLRTRALSILAEDGSGTSWDPIKVVGEPVEESGSDDAGVPPGEEEPAEIAGADRAPDAGAGSAPSLWQWDGAVPSTGAPTRDAYALRLVVGRRLYDNGRLVSESPALGSLRRPFTLAVNPRDAARLGVDAGARVRVTSTRGSQTVGIETDARVPAGVARYDFSADGEGAAALVDADATVTDVRVETIQ